MAQTFRQWMQSRGYTRRVDESDNVVWYDENGARVSGSQLAPLQNQYNQGIASSVATNIAEDPTTYDEQVARLNQQESGSALADSGFDEFALNSLGGSGQTVNFDASGFVPIQQLNELYGEGFDPAKTGIFNDDYRLETYGQQTPSQLWDLKYGAGNWDFDPEAGLRFAPGDYENPYSYDPESSFLGIPDSLDISWTGINEGEGAPGIVDLAAIGPLAKNEDIRHAGQTAAKLYAAYMALAAAGGEAALGEGAEAGLTGEGALGGNTASTGDFGLNFAGSTQGSTSLGLQPTASSGLGLQAGNVPVLTEATPFTAEGLFGGVGGFNSAGFATSLGAGFEDVIGSGLENFGTLTDAGATGSTGASGVVPTDLTANYDFTDIGSEFTNTDPTSGLGTADQFDSAFGQVFPTDGFSFEDVGSEFTNTDSSTGLGTGDQFESAFGQAFPTDGFSFEDIGSEFTNTDPTSGLGTADQFAAAEAAGPAATAAGAGTTSTGGTGNSIVDKAIKTILGAGTTAGGATMPNILAPIITGIGGILGQDVIEDAYDDVKDLGGQFIVGNDRFNQSFDPNLDITKDPTLMRAMEAARDQMYRRLSTKRGNVMWDPNALMETENYIMGNVVLPYLQDTRRLNLSQAGIGADLMGNAIIGAGLANAGKWGAGVSALDEIVNPSPSLKEILSIISGGASTPKGKTPGIAEAIQSFLNTQYGGMDWQINNPDDWIDWVLATDEA